MTDEKQPSHADHADDEVADLKRSLAVIGAELSNVLHKIAPAEARNHFKSAHVEALKGLRVLIDRRIDRFSSQKKKGTTVKVE